MTNLSTYINLIRNGFGPNKVLYETSLEKLHLYDFLWNKYYQIHNLQF